MDKKRSHPKEATRHPSLEKFAIFSIDLVGYSSRSARILSQDETAKLIEEFWGHIKKNLLNPQVLNDKAGDGYLVALSKEDLFPSLINVVHELIEVSRGREEGRDLFFHAGVHYGSFASVGEGHNYIGSDINLACRLCSDASLCQIKLSQAAKELLPQDYCLDTGKSDLKNIGKHDTWEFRWWDTKSLFLGIKANPPYLEGGPLEDLNREIRKSIEPRGAIVSSDERNGIYIIRQEVEEISRQLSQIERLLESFRCHAIIDVGPCLRTDGGIIGYSSALLARMLRDPSSRIMRAGTMYLTERAASYVDRSTGDPLSAEIRGLGETEIFPVESQTLASIRNIVARPWVMSMAYSAIIIIIMGLFFIADKTMTDMRSNTRGDMRSNTRGEVEEEHAEADLESEPAPPPMETRDMSSRTDHVGQIGDSDERKISENRPSEAGGEVDTKKYLTEPTVKKSNGDDVDISDPEPPPRVNLPIINIINTSARISGGLMIMHEDYDGTRVCVYNPDNGGTLDYLEVSGPNLQVQLSQRGDLISLLRSNRVFVSNTSSSAEFRELPGLPEVIAYRVGPASERLAYITTNGREYALNIRNALSRADDRTILLLPGEPLDLVWSPDRSQIAFSGKFSGVSNVSIFLVRSDGRDRGRPLSELMLHPQERMIRISWFPDGVHVAFQSLEGGISSVKRMKLSDVTAYDITLLVSNEWPNMKPAVSPNGKWISFSSTRNSVSHSSQIYLHHTQEKGSCSNSAAPCTLVGEGEDAQWIDF